MRCHTNPRAIHDHFCANVDGEGADLIGARMLSLDSTTVPFCWKFRL